LSGDPGKDQPVFAVIVNEEMLRLLAEGRDLTETLRDPRIGEMARHAHMYQLARRNLG